MALSARYDGIKSKRLRHAFAMQEIEGSPPTDAEILLFQKVERKPWSPKKQGEVIRRIAFGRIKRMQQEQGHRI
ncbi:hypothetical protein JI58_06175 [Marinosulfonomonas sp. PRT-SC04]|nr:hypothetical protein JI58_06175 [Marinosulfonomonas sp. PRT-SC04]